MGLTSSKTNNSTDSNALKEHINQVFKLNSVRSESAITDTLGYKNSTQQFTGGSDSLNTDSLTSLGISPGTAQAPVFGQRGGAAFVQYQNRYKNFRLEKLFQTGGADSDYTESLGYVDSEKKEEDNIYVKAGGSVGGLTDSSEIEALRKILSSSQQSKQTGGSRSPYAKGVELSSTSSQPIDFSALKGGNVDSATSVDEKPKDERRKRRDRRRRSSSSTTEELADDTTTTSEEGTTETTEDTTENEESITMAQGGGEDSSTESLSESASTLSTTESVEKDDEDTESSSHTSEEARRRRRDDRRRRERKSREDTTPETPSDSETQTGGRKKKSKKQKKHKKMYSETSHGSVSEFNIVPFYSSENSSEYFRHMQNRNRFA